MQFNINSIKSRHIFIAIMVIGISFILYGLSHVIFKYPINPEIDNNISSFFFVGVAVLYVYMRQLRKKEEAEKKAAETPSETAEQTTDNPESTETEEITETGENDKR